ncbi:MAG: HAD family hydrolase [Chloroflexi bacterium]|nr:HAD family hydrolase [Chloroflexota bacterium]
MPMTSFRAVVFDFDLTLVNTRRGMVECFNYALAGVGLPPAEPEAIVRTIGVVLEESFPILAGTQHMDLFPQFFALYHQRSSQDMAGMTTLYPSAHSTVRELAAWGVPLGIVSSGRRSRIEATLRKARLFASFRSIIGREDVLAPKPDPTGLLEALRRLGCAPAESFYVGDHVVDAQTAQGAGTPFIAVLSGVTPREAFAPYPHLAILGDLAELPPFLDQLHPPVGGQP